MFENPPTDLSASFFFPPLKDSIYTGNAAS